MPRRTSKIAAALLATALSCTTRVEGYVNFDLPPDTHRVMLQKMTSSVHDAPLGTLTPETLRTLPELMAAWSQSPNLSHDVAPNHHLATAEHLLKRLVDERYAGNDHAVPTTDAYNAILYGWAGSGLGVAAAERAEEIVSSMQRMYTCKSSLRSTSMAIQPNTESFRSVLHAWSNAVRASDDDELSVRAAQRALDVLTWMVRLYKTGENTMVKPDSNCFELVMNAWTNSGHPEAAERVEKLLVIMDRLYQDEPSNDDDAGGDESLRPNARCFDQVLTAWGKRAESSPDAAQRAQDVLDHMEMLASEGMEDAGPSLASYSTVSAAWAKQIGLKGAQRAEEILLRVESRFLAGDSQFRPDAISYNIVTDAYVKARVKDSYKRARELLSRQLKMHTEHGVHRCRPDVFSYTLVLNACAATYGNRKERLAAFNVAESTFSEMRSNRIPANHVTYGTMLKAAAKLLPPGSERREAVVREVFGRCCRDGCVSGLVLNGLRKAASPKLLNELTTADIPHQWSSNVPKHDKGGTNSIKGRPRRRAEV